MRFHSFTFDDVHDRVKLEKMDRLVQLELLALLVLAVYRVCPVYLVSKATVVSLV